MSYARGSGAAFKCLEGPSKAALHPFVGSIGVSKAANEPRPGAAAPASNASQALPRQPCVPL